MIKRKIFRYVLGGLVGSSAFAGHEQGNGGAGFVCLGQQGQPVSAYTVDVILATYVNPSAKEEIVRSDRSQNAWLELMTQRLQSVDPRLARVFRDQLAEMRMFTVFYEGAVDERPIEHYPGILLSQQWQMMCFGVMPPISVRIAYWRDPILRINRTIWAVLDERNRAALWAHEAIYALCRKYLKDQDTLRTWMLTACLLSDPKGGACPHEFDVLRHAL